MLVKLQYNEFVVVSSVGIMRVDCSPNFVIKILQSLPKCQSFEIAEGK